MEKAKKWTLAGAVVKKDRERACIDAAARGPILKRPKLCAHKKKR